MTGVEGIEISHGRSPQSRPQLAELKRSTRQVVGSVFYGTLLQTMRDSKLKGPFGHGGRGEEVFSAQLHNLLAEKMGQATNGGLADVLYESLRAQQERIAKVSSGNRSESSSDAAGKLNRQPGRSDVGLSAESLF